MSMGMFNCFIAFSCFTASLWFWYPHRAESTKAFAVVCGCCIIFHAGFLPGLYAFVRPAAPGRFAFSNGSPGDEFFTRGSLAAVGWLCHHPGCVAISRSGLHQWRHCKCYTDHWLQSRPGPGPPIVLYNYSDRKLEVYKLSGCDGWCRCGKNLKFGWR